jgi:hypothetical protein
MSEGIEPPAFEVFQDVPPDNLLAPMPTSPSTPPLLDDFEDSGSVRLISLRYCEPGLNAELISVVRRLHSTHRYEIVEKERERSVA